MEDLTHREYNVFKLHRFSFHREHIFTPDNESLFKEFLYRSLVSVRRDSPEHKCRRTTLHHRILHLKNIITRIVGYLLCRVEHYLQGRVLHRAEYHLQGGIPSQGRAITPVAKRKQENTKWNRLMRRVTKGVMAYRIPRGWGGVSGTLPHSWPCESSEVSSPLWEVHYSDRPRRY
jgi:hypothetical protein